MTKRGVVPWELWKIEFLYALGGMTVNERIKEKVKILAVIFFQRLLLQCVCCVIQFYKQSVVDEKKSFVESDAMETISTCICL